MEFVSFSRGRQQQFNTQFWKFKQSEKSIYSIGTSITPTFISFLHQTGALKHRLVESAIRIEKTFRNAINPI